MLVAAGRLAGTGGLNASLLTAYAILNSAAVFAIVFAVRGWRATARS